MSNQIQIKKPSRATSRIKAANSETLDISQEKLWVSLPKDMYLHTPAYSKTEPKGCQTEWWWHIGTLKSTDGSRTFGFEINACALYKEFDGNGFTEVMLTDVEKQLHYHETKPSLAIPKLWAESDATKPWFVALGNVLMTAPKTDPTNMSVKAKLTQGNNIIEFDLKLTQEGTPLYVFGNGSRLHKEQTKPNLSDNNYYFSLTRLNASGTIKIYQTELLEPEIIEVSGTTWMDHEWGNFTDDNHGKKQSVKWILQDMQFDNGICLSNFSLKGPKLNKPTKGMATVQIDKNSVSNYVHTTMTPTKSITLNGQEYFTEIYVEIPDYSIVATVISLMPNQLFEGGVYEGVGSVSGTRYPGTIREEVLNGTAWVEQNLKQS